MYRRERAVLTEHFAEDWSDAADPDKPNVFEPGHHIEWVWLLRESERQTGADHGDWIEGLDRVARRHGFGADGLIFDETAADYRPARVEGRSAVPFPVGVDAIARQRRRTLTRSPSPTASACGRLAISNSHLFEHVNTV
jgi:N-acylglucosamine 2-epimerase (GlcNAc 2-epimerase)